MRSPPRPTRVAIVFDLPDASLAAVAPPLRDLALLAHCRSVPSLSAQSAGGLEVDVVFFEPEAACAAREVGQRVRRLRDQLRGEPALVVVVARVEMPLIAAVLEAGARGCLLSPVSAAQCEDACVALGAGDAPLSPKIARALVESHRRPPAPPRTLTPRELAVLAALSHGASYTEIARDLGVRVSTIQTHIKRLYAKLDVSSKAGATRLALAHRWFE